MPTPLNDTLLWSGTEGYDVTALHGDYTLRVGMVGSKTYWNLFYQDVSVAKGKSNSFTLAKMNCIEAFKNHLHGKQ